MTEPIKEKVRLLVKVSKMYYIDGLNQMEISKRLRKSRSQISRLLASAKTKGIVQISINDPYTEENEYERALIEAFGIKDVIVTKTQETDGQSTDYHLSQTAAHWLGSVLQDHDVVGVMAGKTIASIGKYLTPVSRQKMQFVPLIGGWGSEGVSWDANSNTRVFGERLQSRYWQLNAPALVNSQQARNILLDEGHITEILSLARKATVALIGIGQVSKQATIVKAGYMNEQDIEHVRKEGAVANICSIFLDENGTQIQSPFDSRMIGISSTELKQIPYVIAVANGADKVPAIVATLQGNWIDVLIIDRNTAREVIECYRRLYLQEPQHRRS